MGTPEDSIQGSNFDPWNARDNGSGANCTLQGQALSHPSIMTPVSSIAVGAATGVNVLFVHRLPGSYIQSACLGCMATISLSLPTPLSHPFLLNTAAVSSLWGVEADRSTPVIAQGHCHPQPWAHDGNTGTAKQTPLEVRRTEEGRK